MDSDRFKMLREENILSLWIYSILQIWTHAMGQDAAWL